MKKPLLILFHIDQFIMWRIFTPIAHYVDWRWHVNHFRLARQCLRFGYVCFLVGSILPLLESLSWLHALSPLIVLGLLVIIRSMDRDLAKASKDFERDPTRIPRSAIGFVFAHPVMRLLIAMVCGELGIGEILTAPLIHAPGMFLQGVYMLAYVAVYYFAGVFPSFRERKPKRERAPAFPLVPAPAA